MPESISRSFLSGSRSRWAAVAGDGGHDTGDRFQLVGEILGQSACPRGGDLQRGPAGHPSYIRR